MDADAIGSGGRTHHGVDGDRLDEVQEDLLPDLGGKNANWAKLEPREV